MKAIVTYLFVAMGLVHAAAAHASNYQGTITNVFPYNGLVYVAMSGSFGGAASSCPLNSGTMVFSIDPNTAFERTLVSIAVSAKVTGLLVYAAGSGSCSGSNPFSGTPLETLVGMDLKG